MAVDKSFTGFIKHDDYMTPLSAWQDIQPYIPKDKTIWECFYGDGQSGKNLQSLGFNVIHEDIDFFTNDLGDILVSNLPFSMKKKVFTRLKELDKPFIMISQTNMISTKYFKELFKDNIQLIIPKKRIQFQKQVNGVVPDKFINRCNFECFFYCYKMNLHKDIIFA
tara:strand:+ start:2857 stop:3354 length:498 start_codon:yes stop_codon:yes gene_type:complete